MQRKEQIYQKLSLGVILETLRITTGTGINKVKPSPVLHSVSLDLGKLIYLYIITVSPYYQSPDTDIRQRNKL